MKQAKKPNSTTPAGNPEGVAHAYGFAAFNARSFQMVLGSPMILYAKSIGTTATQLGLLQLGHASAPRSGVAAVAVPPAATLGGVLVDLLGQRAPLVMFGMAWSPYALLFAGFGTCFLLTCAAAWRVHEPESAPLDQLLRQAMSRNRLRFWIRLWPRQ